MGLGEFAIGAQVGGGVMSALGAFMSIAGQQSSLRTQAAISEINATSAEQTAQAALLAGQREEQRSMLATSQLRGQQKAGLAASGVDMSQGSAARVLASTDIMGEIDKNTIAANAVRAAWGYRTQATNLSNDAMTKRAAASAMSPVAGAATSALTSAGTIAQNWYQLNKAGAVGMPSNAGWDSILSGTRGSGD